MVLAGARRNPAIVGARCPPSPAIITAPPFANSCNGPSAKITCPQRTAWARLTMSPEHGNTAEVAFYTPKELRALLNAADETLRPLLAIGGLAGLRTAELLRLDWADVCACQAISKSLP